MTFSIIVPIFNAEKYIRRCIESILCQTYSDFEVILIDDGSNDHSLDICLEYSRKDSRVKVIQQKNKGVSSARNAGIEKSTGNWIIFIDADDRIAKNALEISAEVLSKNKQIDTIAWGSNFENKDSIKQLIKYEDDKIFTNIEFLKIPNFHQAVWGYIFSRNIIATNNLRFDEKLSMSEDKLFMLEYLLLASDIFTSKQQLYYYYYNIGSACNSSITLKKCLDQLYACSKIFALRNKYHISTIQIKRHNKTLLECFYSFFYLFNNRKWNKNEYKIAQKVFRDTLKSIKYKYITKRVFILSYTNLQIYNKLKKSL